MTNSRRFKLPFIFAAALVIALAATAHAQITIVNQVQGWMGGVKTDITTTEGGATMLQYDATGVDKLVFGFGSEAGFNNQQMTLTGATFNGTALTQAVQNNFAPPGSSPFTNDGGTGSIWYLDNPAQTTGALTISFTTTGGQPNGGIASLFGLAGTAPGVGNIGDTWTSQGTAGNVSTSLTTSADNSLVIGLVENSGSPNGAGIPTAVGPLTQSVNGEWGNQWGGLATGYQSVPLGGTNVTPTFSTNAAGSIHVVAAEFLEAAPAGPPPVPDMFAMGRVPQSDTSTLLGVTESPFSATSIGSSSIGRLAGLDFQPGTNTLFASSGPGGPNPDSLFTVDPNTGVATLVGTVGTAGGGVADLAIDNSGTIFGHDFASLFTIDPNSGAGTPVGAIPLIEGLAVDPTTDILYGLDPFAGDLYSIDKTTGASNLEGSFGAPGASGSNQWNGFGIDGDGNFFGSVGGGGGEIFALDPSDFSISLLGDAFNGSVSDIAFQRAAVPEPASIALWSLIGLSLAGFSYYRARRKK